MLEFLKQCMDYFQQIHHHIMLLAFRLNESVRGVGDDLIQSVFGAIQHPPCGHSQQWIQIYLIDLLNPSTHETINSLCAMTVLGI